MAGTHDRPDAYLRDSRACIDPMAKVRAETAGQIEMLRAGAERYVEPASEQTKAHILANKFDMTITRLGAVIDGGSEKLAPLLRDPYPKPEPGANKMEFESALLAGMSAKIDRMNELADRLADLFERVEL